MDRSSVRPCIFRRRSLSLWERKKKVKKMKNKNMKEEKAFGYFRQSQRGVGW